MPLKSSCRDSTPNLSIRTATNTRAIANFEAKRAGFPKFKKKGSNQAFRIPQGFKVDEGNSRIFVPKVGWIRFRNSRKTAGTPKNLTIRRIANRWFVCVQTELEAEPPIHPANSMVGIDMGICRFATFSDGTIIPPLSSFEVHRKSLAMRQRSLARKQRFGRNWSKEVLRLQRLHARIRNSRHDFIHKLSARICRDHAIVVLEELKIANMSRSARGSLANPGKNVRSKSSLNRRILDQGWGEFRRQIEYKLAWGGGKLILVPPQFTSQTCPSCGHKDAGNRVSRDEFRCRRCAFADDADAVAALNIIRAGYAQIACQASDAARSPATGIRRGN